MTSSTNSTPTPYGEILRFGVDSFPGTLFGRTSVGASVWFYLGMRLFGMPVDVALAVTVIQHIAFTTLALVAALAWICQDYRTARRGQ